jgi:sugar-specific transcriptional regulator TrmB
MKHLEAIEALTGLGLTLCQSKVYLALCRVGVADAKTCSKIADVARQDFYRIVSTLQDLGLIEKIISYPVSFKAIPINRGTSLLMNRRKQETKELEKKIKNIHKHIRMDNNREVFLKESMFVFVSGRNMVFKKIGKLIENAGRSIDVETSWRRFSKVHYFIDLLTEAGSKGVKIRVIIEIPPKNKASESTLDFFNKKSFCEVKFISYTPRTIVSIYDSKELLLIDNPKAELAEGNALWSNNQSLLTAMQDYFEMKWKKAQVPHYA